jgi:Ca2+-binding RTX toxin-like protein
MDLNDLERIEYNALGGADIITVNDLSGTDVTEVLINLAATGGLGDGQADTVVIDGTNGNDVITLSIQGGALVVAGLTSQVAIAGFESIDTVIIRGLGGDDVIDASAIGADGPILNLQGGAGDDVLIGSGRDDVLLGGDGDDVLIGGPGNDIVDGGPGDDIEIQSVVPGMETEGKVDPSGRNIDFDWLTANAIEVDGSAALNLAGLEAKLAGVSFDSLQSGDGLL